MMDTEIIKALKLCRKNEVHSTCEHCLKCPFSTCDLVADEENCLDALYRRSINLINRQKAEIEELRGNRKFVRGTVARLLETSDKQQAMIEKLKEACAVYEETTGLKQVRSDAIKKFADRLKAEVLLADFYSVEDIDNLVKEMTEGQP